MGTVGAGLIQVAGELGTLTGGIISYYEAFNILTTDMPSFTNFYKASCEVFPLLLNWFRDVSQNIGLGIRYKNVKLEITFLHNC